MRRLFAVLLVALFASAVPAAAQDLPVELPEVEIPPKIPYLGTHAIPRIQTFTDLAGIYNCDPRDPAACLLPFPNNRFTVPDSRSATGRRVNIPLGAAPWNILAKPIDTTELNRNDGFSPGSAILTVVPGLDLARTGAAPITNMGKSLDASHPIVLLNTRTGKRHPFWAEFDANAIDPARRTLIIRPAVNFDEGTRYVVALRNMKNGRGGVIAPNAAFLAERSGRASPAMERVFADLSRAKVARNNLFLAWDFTVASTANITGRMLKIRDDAFASLGGKAPEFEVEVVSSPGEEVARRVQGSFTVPNYLALPNGATTSRFNYLGSTDNLPTRNGDLTAKFICHIPGAAFVRPSRPSLYGHGLLGSRDEVTAGNVRRMGHNHNFTFCATDWIGMAEGDIANVATILVDASNFPSLADRVQQGMLNFLYLARLMKHPNGFVNSPAFRANGKPLIDNRAVYYDGNSQGGIIGGALMAVSQDITRGVLGVPGMNYSTLLNRSIDFDQYASVMYNMYPDKVDQQLNFALMQMLWDRAETNGYAAHISKNPLPKTPLHQVLLVPAVGDHQVANVTTEVEARTIGAHAKWPAFGPRRSLDVVPLWGIPRITQSPYKGSAIVYWDSFRTPIPPLGNVPPRAGSDPHSFPRSQATNQRMKSWFLSPHALLLDTCGPTYCK